MNSIRVMLDQLALRPSKRLGQNFLIHRNSADKILTWFPCTADDRIIEIGPGLGALTRALLAKGCQVYAIEKDRRLAAHLPELMSHSTQLTVIQADALDITWSSLMTAFTPPWTIFGNLPYSVATPLIAWMLQAHSHIRNICLLLQAELVARMCAPPGTKTYGRLSIWTQTLCQIKAGPLFKPGCFYPRPDVDSQLIALTPRRPALIAPTDQADFFQFIAKLFETRRKTLGHIVKTMSAPLTLLADLASPQARPETLDIPTLITLFHRHTSLTRNATAGLHHQNK